jgi:20S proteasome alpha/beta subunit
MGDSRYAFSLTTFSPSGKLGQIEHALQAVHKGKTCLGIQGACAAPTRCNCRSLSPSLCCTREQRRCGGAAMPHAFGF